MPPNLVGAGEVARMLGLTRQRVHQLSREPGFPPAEPVGRRAVWQRADIEAWARAHGREVHAGEP